MRCQSEWPSEIVPEFSHVCHVGDGDSPVTCSWPDTVRINFIGGITRGWGGVRVAIKHTTCGEDGKLQRKDISTVICVEILTLYQDCTSSTPVSGHLSW